MFENKAIKHQTHNHNFNSEHVRRCIAQNVVSYDTNYILAQRTKFKHKQACQRMQQQCKRKTHQIAALTGIDKCALPKIIKETNEIEGAAVEGW